jgi:hypothetical protein
LQGEGRIEKGKKEETLQVVNKSERRTVVERRLEDKRTTAVRPLLGCAWFSLVRLLLPLNPKILETPKSRFSGIFIPEAQTLVPFETKLPEPGKAVDPSSYRGRPTFFVKIRA